MDQSTVLAEQQVCAATLVDCEPLHFATKRSLLPRAGLFGKNDRPCSVASGEVHPALLVERGARQIQFGGLACGVGDDGYELFPPSAILMARAVDAHRTRSLPKTGGIDEGDILLGVESNSHG